MVLFFYRRLTLGILRTKTIKFLFWFCGASWIALILTVSLSCRPYVMLLFPAPLSKAYVAHVS